MGPYGGEAMVMKNFTHSLVILTAIISVACGKKEMSDSTKAISSSVIIGDINWQETEDLAASSFKAINARAVGKIVLPWADSRCTAFLISEDVIMTNRHCIEQASHAEGVTATFDLVAGSTEESRQVFDCSEFIGNNDELDFALLKCQGAPGAQYGFVSLSTVAAAPSSDLYVIHQNCDYYTVQDCVPTKKISEGKLVSIREEDGEYVHNADTLGGSSGSPVFGEDNKVIAIHHAGAGGWFNGRGYENYAVPMHKIVAKIQSSFPAVLGGQAPSEPTPTPAPTPSEPKVPVLVKNKKYAGEVVAGQSIKAQFKQTAFGSVKVVMEIAADAGDLDLYVLDDAGKTVAKSAGTSKLEQVSASLAKGTYTIVVLGYRNASGSFKIKINNAN
ncbi:MAG: hypothetical protein COW01_09975 [Bdellovibrionales bacterium CG12_big_fil_rev_8_21_14_0_65_38_15]|nr:MAG: hypothetical protein COW79_06820 [Bdellovibrionales bacterium CG22_combo_CG10-13_8_21_14_all_38_13]PIQ54464.1 MAG: hypothetical protein COW01_09975 [Bdellovibrionales bacterium CG12_big_fil_rev_8_21_14_0_65_38_15]PIR29845.1 MAG: hypothetical protein COV38_07820 [Bdellovibrionales bacterium CG11_big_fil_rev_8_21_14_0_20_38_13]